MVIIEFFVAMRDAGRRQAAGENATAIVDLVLVTPAAVHIEPTQGTQRRSMPPHHMDRIMSQPALPVGGDQLARLGVEWQAKAQWCPRLWIVGGSHAHIHERQTLGM